MAATKRAARRKTGTLKSELAELERSSVEMMAEWEKVKALLKPRKCLDNWWRLCQTLSAVHGRVSQ
jgi:hypothetical protein